jgi:glucosamine-6-phosphate deaminase
VTSAVEKLALAQSREKLRYDPEEKIAVITVKSFPDLGRLAALRFLEYAQNNPGGVISLPTGKTPETFIREVNRFLSGWRKRDIAAELARGGVDPARRPRLRSFHFVQIDEFYPIDPEQQNSFTWYVRRYYLEGFGLDPARALLMDCRKIGLPENKSFDEVWPERIVDLSLRYRTGRTKLEKLQKQVLEAIDQWCVDYEAHVRSLGGIGFFLGGIGPDGHVGFNVRGSDPYSTTRLTATNYETQAAAAADLGGIEVAGKRLVITIGLGTITFNPGCTAVIIAAGEAKAAIVAASVESSRQAAYPASSLQCLKNARFYITRGAARMLSRRRYERFVLADRLPAAEIEQIVSDLALKLRVRIEDLTRADYLGSPCSRALLEKSGRSAASLNRQVADSWRAKIVGGTLIRRNTVFLHTEPHHDDLMLGCLPFIIRHIREHSNSHHFVTLTSGFTAVTNAFMLAQLRRLVSYLSSASCLALDSSGYFEPGSAMFRNRDVWQYLDGVAAHSAAMREDGALRRLTRNLADLYGESGLAGLAARAGELIAYFESQYPGSRDPEHVQKLKGMCREWEADCLWGFVGWDSRFVRHLRLGFYRGQLFGEDPTLSRDVAPILRLLHEIRPAVVTLALDPEASGPDTHYKVLQAITAALSLYVEESGCAEPEILGYRNVWYRFQPGEADLMVPVSLNMFALQTSAFMNTFISQKAASFPSYEHEGPFSELAQKIQVEQYQKLKTCLGRGYFHEHPSALIRATRGMVFLKSMSLGELLAHSRELKKTTETFSG